MAVTEHIIKSRDDSFTCECGSGLFHGPWDFIVPSGETVPTCTCAACGRYHLLLRARAEEENPPTFDWTCPSCGAVLPSSESHCPCREDQWSES